MKTQEVVSSFMADCKLRGLSDKTLETYNSQLNNFASAFPGKFPPKPEIIQVFIANLKGEYNRDSHYRTLKDMCNFAKRRKLYKGENPMSSVTRPRIHKKISPIIDEITLLLLPLNLSDPKTSCLRDKAIIGLALDTAIRQGELLNLKRKDILDDRIVISGKTGYGVVPLSKTVREFILALPERKDGYVWSGRNHGNGDPPRLGKSGLYKICKKYLLLSGYQGERRFGLQTLRVSFGVLYLKDKGDMRSLQCILRHKNIQTTADYYTPYQQQDIVEKHHEHTPGRVFEEAKVSD